MKAKFIKYLILLFLTQTIVQICAKPEDLPSNSSGTIQFYVDDASFFNSGKIYKEFYLMIYTDQLKLVNKNNSLFADLTVSLSISTMNNDIVDKRTWETQAKIGLDEEMIESSIIYDQWGELLDQGLYNLELEVKDNISGKYGVVRRKIDALLDKSNNEIFLSEIQFASSFSKEGVDSNSIFNKENLTVIPNPSRRYGLLNPFLYFYFEAYNQNKIDSCHYTITYQVLNSEGTPIRSLNEKTLIKSDATSGFPKGINVSVVASGIYSLVVEIKNGQEIIATTTRQFEILQIDYFEKNEQLQLTKEQAEMFGEIIQLVSSETDYQLYQNLNNSGKAKFLIEFWLKNDTHPVTNKNDLFDRILERYSYANKNFSWGKIQGWKTDRGRILIKYGMPDNIQRYTFEESTSPYQIWEYHGRKNYYFVFGDLRDNGKFTLLHSTKEEEIYNPYWKEELNKM